MIAVITLTAVTFVTTWAYTNNTFVAWCGVVAVLTAGIVGTNAAVGYATKRVCDCFVMIIVVVLQLECL